MTERGISESLSDPLVSGGPGSNPVTVFVVMLTRFDTLKDGYGEIYFLLLRGCQSEQDRVLCPVTNSSLLVK